MSSRLIVIAGPLKGATVALPVGTTTIGRDISSDVVISDSRVSRRHATIAVSENGECRLSDHESANGTLVNGVPIRAALLKEGDVVQVGASLFVVSTPSLETPASSTVGVEDPILEAHTTVRITEEDLIYFRPEPSSSSKPRDQRLLNELKALLAVGKSIGAMRDMDALQERLLDHVFEAIPAERGAILLLAQEDEELVTSTYRDRKVPSRPSHVSRSVASQVLREGRGILSNAVLDVATFNPSESLVASKITSLLCVPISAGGKPLGVIYADTSDTSVRFNESDLHLLTGIAAIASMALDQVSYLDRLRGENQRLQEEINLHHDLVGDSPQIHRTLDFIAKACAIDSTVLIRGESGTGKELVARAIHRNSRRKTQAFIAINCAALTDTLLESELFGHEKGAFTGAITQKKGKIEMADGGTLFLDEVGELSLQAQAKLLRVLQEREFERIGGTRTIKVNIRLIAATNRDLEDSSKGAFRQDLFYRLNVVSVTLPPLRERREDIPLLAIYFLHRYSKECNRNVTGILPAAMSILKAHNWPGNIRELQNAIERAVALGSSDRICPEDLPENLLEEASTNSKSSRYHDGVAEAKRKLILDAVEQSRGSIVEAAKILNLNSNYLHRLIQNLDLRGRLKKI